MKTKDEKMLKVSAILRKYFVIMSDDKMKDEDRATRLETLRGQIDGVPLKLLLKAVKKELRRTNSGFVYNLFLQNIQFQGKL